MSINIREMLDFLIRTDKITTIDVIKDSDIFPDLLENYVYEGDLRDTEKELKEVEQNLEFMESLSRPLYEAICEDRKDDAIHLLSEMFEQHFNDSAIYAKLFPGRVK